MGDAQGAFVLMPGGRAGGWVWDDVIPLLMLPALAVDLPGHGPRPGDLATLSFAECVRDSVAELPVAERLILVGHSLGAAVILPLGDRLVGRVAQVVCLAGPIPRPGESVVDTFPLLMRLASWLVLRCSGAMFSPGRRMSERTLFNGLDPARATQVASPSRKASRRGWRRTESEGRMVSGMTTIIHIMGALGSRGAGRSTVTQAGQTRTGIAVGRRVGACGLSKPTLQSVER